MAKDAYIFLIPLLALLIFCFWVGYLGLAIVLLFLSGFVGYFFRDPERAIPEDPRAIVSPADGKVIRLEQEGEGWILSIFLSLFDVHINRAPIGGTLFQSRICLPVGNDARSAVNSIALADNNLTFGR